MLIQITNLETGEQVTIARDVTSTHPQWVHDQLGTSNETELQRLLDNLNVEDWYGSDDSHLGDDEYGLAMYRGDKYTTTLQRVEGEWFAVIYRNGRVWNAATFGDWVSAADWIDSHPQVQKHPRVVTQADWLAGGHNGPDMTRDEAFGS